jgi:zinc/manganese transport system substrate-binding protein
MITRLPRRQVIGLLATAPLVPSAQAATPILASFSILADMAREVGGARVGVTSITPLGVDPHHFDPKPSELRHLAAARALIHNGLGLDPWAARAGRASGFKGVFVTASTGARTLTADRDPHGHGHAQGGVDPHCWHDVGNAKRYAENIRDGLIAADPAGTEDYRERAGDYLARLDALDAEIKARLAPIPRDRRRVVTTHAAFAYYARAYQVDFLAPLGMAGQGEPSARDFAALIARIKRERIRALFLERAMPPRLMEQLSRETGVRIAGALYADTLSPPDGPAASYVALMRHNTDLIAEALV